jgi:hypothetical protein
MKKTTCKALFINFLLLLVANLGNAQNQKVDIFTNWGKTPRDHPVSYVFFENICHRDSTIAEIRLVNEGRQSVKLDGGSFSKEFTFCDGQGNSLELLPSEIGRKGEVRLSIKYKSKTMALLAGDMFVFFNGKRHTIRCIPCYRYLRHQKSKPVGKELEIVVQKSKNCHDSLFVCFTCNAMWHGVSLYDKGGFYPKLFGQYDHQLYCRVNIAYLPPGRFSVRVTDEYSQVDHWVLVVEE